MLPSAPAQAGLGKSHLLLLAQNHLHPVHGHNDAHFLLLNILGFELILVGRKTQVRREVGLGTVCGISRCFTLKCQLCV